MLFIKNKKRIDLHPAEVASAADSVGPEPVGSNSASKTETPSSPPQVKETQPPTQKALPKSVWGSGKLNAALGIEKPLLTVPSPVKSASQVPSGGRGGGYSRGAGQRPDSKPATPQPAASDVPKGYSDFASRGRGSHSKGGQGGRGGSNPDTKPAIPQPSSYADKSIEEPLLTVPSPVHSRPNITRGRGDGYSRGTGQGPDPKPAIPQPSKPEGYEASQGTASCAASHPFKGYSQRVPDYVSRGRGSQPRGGQGGRGGHAPSTPSFTIHQAIAFLNKLSAGRPDPMQAEALAAKVATENAEMMLRLLIASPHKLEDQLLWLFSQYLFVASNSVDLFRIATVHNLLRVYWSSDAFSADRIARVTVAKLPEGRFRYLMIFRKIRDVENTNFIRRLEDEETLDMFEGYIDKTKSELVGLDEHLLLFNEISKEHLLQECDNMTVIIDTIRSEKSRPLAKPELRRTVQQPDDDPNFSHINLTSTQNTDFPLTFMGTRVEPTLLELKHAPAHEARRIAVGAPIDSLNHHLDTVFHATRNDALRPLREGVQYLYDNDMKLPKGKANAIDVKVISDLEFSTVAASPEQGAVFVFRSKYLLDLVSQRKNILRRRLLPGNIVVLTKDKLQSGEVCVLVQIARYDAGKGFICLRRAEEGAGDDSLGPLKDIRAVYTIVESSVYWETHVHSLKAIKNLSNPQLTVSRIFDHVRCLDANQDADPMQPEVRLPDLASQFDSTQAEAFKHIFNSPSPIVQGPPGTGKSYIGVRAVKHMLEEEDRRPVLIVCYTNHALDSFMLDLLKAAPQLKEGNCYRLGFNTKSEELKKFQLPDANVNAPFYFALGRLEKHWNEARSTSFVPTVEDGIPLQVCKYFEKLRQPIRQRLDDASYVVEKAKHNLENLLLAAKNAPAGMQTARAKLIENARARFQDCEKEFSIAKSNFDRYLLIWKEGKGKIAATATVKTTEVRHEDDDDDDIGEENVERFIEEQENDVDPNADANWHHLHVPIQRVVLPRPDFVNDQLDCERINAAQRHLLCDYLFDDRVQRSLPGMEKHICDVRFAAERRKGRASNHQISVLHTARVIGATTTGLAKHLEMMKKVGVRCVMLEEAAEIPECHALAALIPGVDRFIQIGDHQQLRPKIASYESIKLNLNISLMERMLSCNNNCKTLSTQRRMRPEICDFIRPMYAKRLADGNLYDHSCVLEYPTDPSDYGLVSENGFVLYINHNFAEASSAIGMSYENPKEAEFATYLAVYFSKQRPEASITILVPYSGQLLRVREVFKKPEVSKLTKDHNIRVVSIDDFQGEESDVVILALTRSTTPGFFKENNRICVSLSRARHLQVVVGNFKCFEQQNKKCLWPSTLQLARQTPAGISGSISLKCQCHQTTRGFKVGSDPFPTLISATGGCCEQCNKKMSCGHICNSVCHGNVDCGAVAKCVKSCVRRGPKCTMEDGDSPRTCNHECRKLCSVICGPCKEKVKTTCRCGKELTVECHTITERGSYKECPSMLEHILPCGHKQTVKCYEKYVDHSTVICKSVCGQMLPDCRHKCMHKCSDCLPSGADCHSTNVTYSHGPCKSPCTKQLVCGHVCANPCSSICAPCVKKCEYNCEHHKVCTSNGKPHNCGMPNKCIDCSEKCQNMCKHSSCTKLCHEVCDRSCNERCDKLLKCGHQCQGVCGEQCLSRCFVCRPWTEEELDDHRFGEDDDDALLIELPCKHIVDMESMDKYMAMQTDYASRAITYPLCPKCSQLVVWGPTINRYKGCLNSARETVNKAKSLVIERTEKALAELKQCEQHLDTMVNALGDTLKFANVLSFPDAIAQANSLRNRLTNSSSTNLQLTSSLSRRINLLWMVYAMVTLTSNLPEIIFLALNEALGNLLLLPPNAGASDLDEVIREAFQMILSHPMYGHIMSPDATVEELAKAVHSRLGLTEQERKSIHAALTEGDDGIQRSGAYKMCPCGFIYVIGGCGGAEVIANCPDCNRQIGGQQHRDIEGTSHVGDFDDSVEPAWPQ